MNQNYCLVELGVLGDPLENQRHRQRGLPQRRAVAFGWTFESLAAVGKVVVDRVCKRSDDDLTVGAWCRLLLVEQNRGLSGSARVEGAESWKSRVLEVNGGRLNRMHQGQVQVGCVRS
jgi:hypothetical protein